MDSEGGIVCMKHGNSLMRKGIALMTALILALLPALGLAAVESDLSIALLWGEGEMAYASRVSYEGYSDCYWVQVPSEALGGLTLQISDPNGWYTGFSPANGEMLLVPEDAGSSLTAQSVMIEVYTADNSLAGTVYLYVSSYAPYPDMPYVEAEPTEQPPVEDARVLIHYVDENGQTVASDTEQIVSGGTWQVYAQPYNLQEYYELDDSSTKEVTVDYDGAHPAEVYFRYRYNKPVPAAAMVTIHYMNESGQRVASDTQEIVEAGSWSVQPNPWDLQEYYELNDEASKQVTVDFDGAHPAEVTFLYRYNRPAPEAAAVTIHYVDENGQAVASDTQATVEAGTWGVQPAPWDLQEYYELNDESVKQVTVDYDGAHPNEVTFLYRYNRPAPEAAAVTIHYVNEEGQPVASDTQATVEAGTWGVQPAPWDLQEYYELNDENVKQVTVDYDGAHPNEVTFLYRFNRPAAPAVSVTIHYVNEFGWNVASDTRTILEEGVWDVKPMPDDLLPGYELNDETSKQVTVDYDGAHPQELTFVYVERMAEPTEEPTPEPTEEPTPEPTEEPTPEPTEEPTPEPTEEPTPEPTEEPTPEPTEEPTPEPTEEPTPEPTEEPTPEPTEEPTPEPTEEPTPEPTEEPTPEPTEEPTPVPEDQPTEAPLPKMALVLVRYLRPDGEPFYTETVNCQENQDNVIALNWDLVDPAWNYELASPESVRVAVDSEGVATPDSVVFQFKNEVNASVIIRFQDALTGRDVASPKEKLCYVGNNVIKAEPDNLEANYALADDEENRRNVTLDWDGTLTPSEVVFRYVYLPTPTPVPATPTPLPVDVVLDGWGYPTGKSVNFRSGPTTEENNIIGTIKSSDLLHVIGQTYNGKGECWYAVEFNGRMGFLKDSVLRILSDAEMAALFNYTPSPDAPTATPVPTEIPDGAPIDRWAVTNSKVNFRRTPETINGEKSNRIGEVKKGTRVWVYESVTQNGEKWYRVQANGKDGYLMGKFVDVMSREESEQVQSALTTPMPTQQPLPTASPEPSPEPEPTETLTPLTPPPEMNVTATPAPYRGYALTQGVNALRTGAGRSDETILEMLPEFSLVEVSGQTMLNNEIWYSVQAMASGNYGFLPKSAVQPISNEAARPYLDALQPAIVATPSPMPEPVYGYGMTMWDNVPMRAFPDTNALIIDMLPYQEVAYVQGQEYGNDTTWHVVQYKGQHGFILENQLRILSEEESRAYERRLNENMQTPEPVIEATPEPITESSLSSYGHVISNSGKVNLRTGPSRTASQIRLLDNYAFALVLGSEVNDEGMWYHVIQAGSEGYISGSYFKVLSMGELTQFLQSDSYINANTDGASSSGNTSSQIQPLEDYSQTVWQNPNLSPSYEPFNPYATPTPDPERIVTPEPTLIPVTPQPTAEIAAVSTDSLNTPPPNNDSQGGGMGWLWALLAIAAVGGGGAYYAYTIHQRNERRRQAMRAQQARQARAAQQPQMRAAQNNPTSQQPRSGYGASSAPFMPPQGGAPRPAQQPVNGARTDQSTTAYRPAYPAGQPAPSGAPSQETQAYRPAQNMQTAQRPGAAQATQAFRPAQDVQTAQQPGASQATQAFRPAQDVQTAQRPAASQATQAFRPAQDVQTVQQPGVSQATQAFRPAQDVQTAQQTVWIDKDVRAGASAAAQSAEFSLNQPPKAADVGQQAQQELKDAAGDAPTTYQRHRRSERHQNPDGQQS